MSEKTVEMKRSSVVWYQTALEKASPLRFYLHNLITEIEMHNRFLERIGQPPMPPRTIDEAKAALQEAEEFFTGVKTPEATEEKE